MSRDEQLKSRWDKLSKKLAKIFGDGETLDLDAIIYLIGVQELGRGHQDFKKDDNFNGNFALSLYEVAKKNKDEKMMKLAQKHYQKVKNKDELTEQMRNKFEN